MKVVISNFSINKTHIFTNMLPVILLILIFYSCSTSNSYKNHNKKDVLFKEKDISKDKIRERIIKKSKYLLGTKYRYGGKNPNGFDCSGFVYYIFKNEGIYLPGSSKSQSKIGKLINLKKCKPGDLVFFKNKGKINHVGVVVKNTKKELFVIHSTSSSGVKKDDILSSNYWKKRVTFARDVIAN